MSTIDPRTCFAGAARGFTELVGQVGADDWDRPALGDWDVRALVGHTSRALSTIEAYLGKSADGPVLEDPVAYFVTALSSEIDPSKRRQRDTSIAERGRESGAGLGADPAAKVAELTQRVLALVGSSADDNVVATPSGTMTLVAYLPTRTFELAVHSLDLERALGLPAPATMLPAVTASCELAGRLAGLLPRRGDLLLLLTGRTDLPGPLSVL